MCRVMTEFLYCQDRLIRSACGSSIADFALAVSIENQLSSPDVVADSAAISDASEAATTKRSIPSSLVVIPAAVIEDSSGAPCLYQSLAVSESGTLLK